MGHHDSPAPEPVDLARVAFEELDRRERAGELSAPARDQIIEVALDAERDPAPVTPVQYDLMGYLSEHMLSGDLTAEQQRRFYEPAALPQLVARPRVIPGERVPVRMSNPPWKASWGHLCAVTETIVAVELDGKPVELSPPPSRNPVWLASMSSADVKDWFFAAPSLGHHQVKITAQFDVHDGEQSYEPDQGRVVHSSHVSASAPFDVEQPGPANAVRLIDSPGLAEKVDKSIIRMPFPLRALYNVGGPGRCTSRCRYRTCP